MWLWLLNETAGSEGKCIKVWIVSVVCGNGIEFSDVCLFYFAAQNSELLIIKEKIFILITYKKAIFITNFECSIAKESIFVTNFECSIAKESIFVTNFECSIAK